jgi:AraC-like DNA-binding protein
MYHIDGIFKVNEQNEILLMHKSESTQSPPTCLFAINHRTSSKRPNFMHSHACTEIIWYRRCTGCLIQNDQPLQYKDGNVAIYQPGSKHIDACRTRGTQMCIGVTGARAHLLQEGMWQTDENTQAVLQAIHRQIDQPDDWQRERLNWMAGWLTVELSRQIQAQRTCEESQPHHVTVARQICDTRFAERLTVAGISEELSVNPDYLRQMFSKWVGVSPLGYLINKRLNTACDLLRLNQESTRQIAARVGIDNPYYFSRLFKKRFGMSPTQYRNQYAI